MRPNGDRNWPRSACRALLLACAFTALGAAPASAAADRYAVVSGGATFGDCDQGMPCTLATAVGEASGGDTVHLQPGTYNISAPISRSNVTVTGGTSDDTTIIGSATITGAPVVSLSGSATIQNLTIESRSTQPALDLTGTGDGLEIYSRAGNALVLRGGSALSTSVVHTPVAGATAVRVAGGLATSTNVRRSTVVATGANSIGIDSSGLLTGVNVRSSVANGVGDDVVGDLLSYVNLTYSVWRDGNSQYASGDATNYDGAAVFADPGSFIFEQDLASPTINRGEGDGASADLAGRQRQIGSRVDVGAYEAPLPPTAVTGVADTITDSSARVPVTTNARTVSTQRWVEYGTDVSLGESTTPASAGSTASDVTANINLTGLLPGTTYYYRAVAGNEWDTVEGTTRSFDTLALPPVPTTAAPSAVTAVAATLEGTVDRGGATTTAWFEWGETASYGNTTAVQNLGDGPDAVALSGAALTGLQPNTEYHYRVVAQNAEGRVESSDASFRTPVRAPIVTVDAPSGVTTTAATISGTVNPGGDSTDWHFDYGVGGYGQTVAGSTLTGTSAQAVTRSFTGLLPGTTYAFRLVAENSQGPTTTTGTFTTEVAPPAATTGDADPVAPRSATIAGRVNMGGGSGSWRVEYGTTASYGSVKGPHAQPAGTSDADVETSLTGLEPATTYHYRVVATNAKGTVPGGDATFTTPADRPAVTTTRSRGVDLTSAHLDGTVDPGGDTTTWEIEYGKTAAYGDTTAAETLPTTVPGDTQPVTAKVEGLEPGTTYHFRVVAENSAGSRGGADMTFTTDAPVPPAPPRANPPAPAPVAADDVTEPGGNVLPQREPTPGQKTADGLPAPDPTPAVAESANAAPAGGTIRVRVPGSSDYVTLTEGAGIPMGSIVDATEGQVTITSAADSRGRVQSANFGGSEFKLMQKRAARPITDIVLTGGHTGCTARPLAKTFDADVFASARRKWSRRRLWGNGHGRFRTRGRRATATVRGTHWLTEDRCDGTLVKVRRGLVEVRDLVRRKKVMVPAGRQYVAKTKLSKKEKRALKRKRGRR